jgi:hypothetical protein
MIVKRFIKLALGSGASQHACEIKWSETKIVNWGKKVLLDWSKIRIFELVNFL